MVFRYQTGEEVKKGDRVLFHGEPGEIEFVAAVCGEDPGLDWYIQEYGGGVMVLEPRCGRAFVTQTEDAEDLVFVSRCPAE
jgi:hypothetical protein